MHDVLGRFFGAVVLASLAVLISGVWMLARVTATAGFVIRFRVGAACPSA
jgi:hypothetical protein